MSGGGSGVDSEPPDIIDRQSLAFSQPAPGMVLRSGDTGFTQQLAQLYDIEESNASEKLVLLKDTLRKCDSEDFWVVITEGLADISGAQYAFISKRILLDDEKIAVEMPPIGEPGACLMGAAFYINDGHGFESRLRNFKYHAYSCPCAYMKHDKIFIIPERLNEFIVNNPNKLTVPGEAYLGIPLFADGKCFAHFGVMWSPEGAAKRKLGWGFLEMVCHSLEDMILDRVLQGEAFAGPAIATPISPAVIPHDAITVTQSLKPYARSLSHELRTPMQGVVGMLDVMYATVQEAFEAQRDPRARSIFESLKQNIEVVQDSSRRAVEAADNVVHAYDMNMGVPETPPDQSGDATPGSMSRRTSNGQRPEIVVNGNDLPLSVRPNKRRRSSITWSTGSTTKQRYTDSSWSKTHDSDDEAAFGNASTSTTATATTEGDLSTAATAFSDHRSRPSSPTFNSEHTIVPGLRHTNLRYVLQYVVNDSLKVGGRPESAIAQETETGEIIEVRTRLPNGQEKVKHVEWSVHPDVPESILIDEKDFAKMITTVVLNAIKFTEEGQVDMTARMSPNSRYIVINVKDTGTGIQAAFQPNLFKAFSREDHSITRTSEGLGLGLMVGQGIARRLGGDMYLIRSEVDSPEKGSEFEMRVPMTSGDAIRRSESPFGSRSPTPSFKSLGTTDVDPPPPSEVLPTPGQPPIAPSETSITSHPSDLAFHAANSLSVPPSMPRPKLTRATPVSAVRRPSSTPVRKSSSNGFDRHLAEKHPLTFLVAEDNKINRKLLVNMLQKFGYRTIHEAYDGADAVRQMMVHSKPEEGSNVDIVLMDLWMPYMDGYEAAEKILEMEAKRRRPDGERNGDAKGPTILAVTADVTDGALERASKVGMKGFMTKPYKLMDLERLIIEYCARQDENLKVQPLAS